MPRTRVGASLLTLLMLVIVSRGSAGNVTVYAAASLVDAFTEAGRVFDRKTGHRTVFQFAGSQVLRTQLENGAPADVFASANSAQYDPLVRAGLMRPGEVFARNRLVVITPARSSTVNTLKDLARPGIRVVLATPNVPAGSYARQTLALVSEDPSYGADFARRVLANVVSEEPNVRQVALKVQLGEADAAFVYTTDVTATLRPLVRRINVPVRFNPSVGYPIGTTRNASSAANEFVKFVLSGEGQRILRKWGFLAP